MVKSKTASQSKRAVSQEIGAPREELQSRPTAVEDALIKAFQQATPQTIDSIDAELARVGVQLKGLRGAESALRLMRKSLDFRFGRGMDPGRIRGDENRLARLQQIAAYLWEKEPAKGTQISHATGIPAGSLTAFLKHRWFKKTAEGFEISEEGCDDPICAAEARRESEVEDE